MTKEMLPIFIESNDLEVDFECPIWVTTKAQGESIRKVMDEIQESLKRSEPQSHSNSNSNSIVLEDPLFIPIFQ